MMIITSHTGEHIDSEPRVMKQLYEPQLQRHSKCQHSIQVSIVAASMTVKSPEMTFRKWMTFWKMHLCFVAES